MEARQSSVLVVDDSEMYRVILSWFLDRQGLSCSIAEDAEQALEQIARQSFDLVLLDIGMPGLSGLEVLKTLRKTKSPTQLPVIMVTIKSQSADMVEALRLGANDYVTKPIDFPLALARIQTQLWHKRSADSLRESEERYALAVRGANDGLWDWNLKDGEVYFSPRWKSMLGYENGEIGNRPEDWFQRVHPEDLMLVKSAIDAHLQGQTAHYESVHRMLDQNGTHRWMLSRGLAVRDPQGKATRMAGSQTDITEVKVGDALTGLPNRLLFMDRLERVMKRAKRHKDYLFALFFLDVDRFKVINDSLGHLLGDQLLVAIARRVESSLRFTDSIVRYEEKHTLARLGGDEFTILLDDIKHVNDATRVAERLHSVLSLPFNVNGHEVFTSASIGIAVSATGYDRPEEMLRDADTAMYRAKALGKARYELFDPAMRDRAVARLQMETDLRKAIDRREFRNVYQPIVSLSRGRIVGFEALVRWQHPARGLVAPGEFVPVAEETGMILWIGRWVLEDACRQMKAWQTQFVENPPLIISVNLSSKQFLQAELVEQIGEALRQSRLGPSSLRLEITESLLMENLETATSVLLQLKALGIRLSLDDFGTGYSSLSYLHRFPMDTLKIDRSFVSRIGPQGENSEIVRTIVTLAENLGMDVIAEGVETPEQLALLRSLGCQYAQGHYFSKPVEAQAAEDMIDAQL